MGGMYGEVRGATKVKTYLCYQDETERHPDGSWYPDPSRKKACKRQMEKDPVTGEWVLPYHWHS